MELLPAPSAATSRFAAPEPLATPPRLPGWPWLLGDVLGVTVANVVGMGLLLSGLYGTRHTTEPERLLLLLTVAASGLVVSLAGNAVFLLTGLRQAGRLRTELLGRKSAPATAQLISVPDDDSGALVAAPSMTRYHRADCPAAAGKPVVEATLADHLAAERRPCALCLPPEASA